MKLCRISYRGEVVLWCRDTIGARANARRQLAEQLQLSREQCAQLHTTTVDVPITARELITWLNESATA